ncbi:MAG: TerC family protein [Verrucomicrobia bacterium]|nr:TerC family protein [Verrucomicrobiota bacterium]
MLALTEITTWHWVAFIAGVLIFVGLDLFVFHRGTHAVTFKDAFFWTTVCFCLAMLFGVALIPTRGQEEAMEFVTGYIIELALSMDNVFVIALIFSYFQVPSEYQHRVLFFGFIDALIMRGTIIGIGTVAVQKFHFILYFLGAFLVYSGVKMIFSKEEGVHPEKNPVIKLAQRIFPVSTHFDGAHFFTRLNGRLALTPLALVLLMVETTDLVFAVDSIPAIFSVTTKPFIIFTSNIFAILGLRSLYFVLVGALEYFRYLKVGLSVVLIFIGAKMLGEHWIKIPTIWSLCLVAGIIVASIILSILAVRRQPHPAKEVSPEAGVTNKR